MIQEEIEIYKQNYVVYIHRNKITGNVFYVGMGNGKRPYDFHGRGKIWKNYVNKYGKPTVEVYRGNLDITEATYLEHTLIKTFGRKRYEDYGVLINQKFGDKGMSGYKMSEQTKSKISIAFKGETGINYGRKHSEKSKKNMSLAAKGRKWSDRQRELFKKYVEQSGGSRKGAIISEETKIKLRNFNIGKKMSPESILKMRNSLKGKGAKKIINNKTGVIYKSLKDAANENEVTFKLMWKWVNGLIKSRIGQFSYYGI